MIFAISELFVIFKNTQRRLLKILHCKIFSDYGWDILVSVTGKYF